MLFKIKKALFRKSCWSIVFWVAFFWNVGCHPCIWFSQCIVTFFSHIFKIHSLSLVFSNLTMMYMCVCACVCIQTSILWMSWIYMFYSLILENLWPLFIKIPPLQYFLFSFEDVNSLCIRQFDIVSQPLDTLSIFTLIFFFVCVCLSLDNFSLFIFCSSLDSCHWLSLFTDSYFSCVLSAGKPIKGILHLKKIYECIFYFYHLYLNSL